MIGYNGEGVYSEKGIMTLLFANGQGKLDSKFYDNSNHYSDSTHQATMGSVYTALMGDPRESGWISSRDLKGNSGNQGQLDYNDDHIAGVAVDGALRVFNEETNIGESLSKNRLCQHPGGHSADGG